MFLGTGEEWCFRCVGQGFDRAGAGGAVPGSPNESFPPGSFSGPVLWPRLRGSWAGPVTGPGPACRGILPVMATSGMTLLQAQGEGPFHRPGRGSSGPSGAGPRRNHTANAPAVTWAGDIWPARPPPVATTA